MRPGKRAMDLAIAGLAVALLAPVLLAVAVLVWVREGRPILFRHERIGRDGRPFRLLKFRTMRPADGPEITIAGDDRVTRTGQWLRRLRLDELPQLFNVLAGEMSLVGPRPEVARYVAAYTPDEREVLRYAPGITDPASLYYWDESTLLASVPDPDRAYRSQILPDKVRRQLDYCRRATAASDVRVLASTAGVVWRALGGALAGRLVAVRRPLILLVHAAVITAGYAIAFGLRFDLDVPASDQRLFLLTLPWLLVIRLATYGTLGMFRGFWRHFSLHDLVRLGQAATLGSFVFAAVLSLLGFLPGVPRAVLFMEWVAAIFLLGGVHFLARLLLEASPVRTPTGRRTVVIGVGEKAAQLLHGFHLQPGDQEVVGLVCTTPADRGRSLHGYQVLGCVEELEVVLRLARAETAILALDAPPGHLIKAVVDTCLRAGVECKTLPSMREMLAGTARADRLRDVCIEDLLGRRTVSLPPSAVEAAVRGRVVVVTGGAGSIGSELARQCARCGPGRLVLVDQAESALFLLDVELRESYPDLDLLAIVADVTDGPGMRALCYAQRPDFVFHAAAYKHVPLMERHALEATRNNVLGTLSVARAAAASGAGAFTLISTDKAVNPSSVMGASKRAAERVVLGLVAHEHHDTQCRAVRFGNVLGSAGSVVPLFERQIVRGGPLTVTHPEVERYFMTIPEAVELVLHASVLPEAAGRVTMLEMGQPVRILDLAEQMIRLAGLVPHRDVPIVFSGLRPGEKLREELVTQQELTVACAVPGLHLVDREETATGLEAGLADLRWEIERASEAGAIRVLKSLVPEFRPSGELPAIRLPDLPASVDGRTGTPAPSPVRQGHWSGPERRQAPIFGREPIIFGYAGRERRSTIRPALYPPTTLEPA